MMFASRSHALLTWTATLMAVVIILIWPSLHFSGDSRHYLYASQSLLDGRGFVNDPAYSQRSVLYSEWPPLYPVILAVFRLVGMDPLTGVRLLNAACYGLTVWLVLRHAQRYHFAIALAMLMPPLIVVFRYVLTEPLFLPMVLLFVLWLPDAPRRIVPLAVLTALAWLLRYAGVFLLVFGCAYILRRWGWRLAILFAVLPLVSMSGWLLRNWMDIGHPLGVRGGARYPAHESIAWTVETLTLWAVTLGVPIAIERGLRWIANSYSRLVWDS